MSRNTVNGISHSELLPHDFREMILKVLKMFLGLVFAGWIFLWIIVPTSTWKYHWSPKLYSNTYSTYFGRQGTNILIYAFPILFITVVGCIYLHFRQKKHYTGSRSGILSSLIAGWKRPVLVQGPLGVVSGIEFTFGFSYNPMSTIFINIPSVSKLQWHPFTVTSSSNLEPERLSVIIKKEGSWTQKLHAVLSSPIANDHISVSVEGPYSPISMNILRYESLVMVSGGSGITPFISIIRELIYQSNIMNTSTPEILLVCVFRNSLDLTVLDLLLPICSNVSDFSNLKLRIEAYVTKEKEKPTNHEQRVIRTICFKPHPSDVPISPVLGSNSWLYLAVIISASFVAFLVLTGILQRYYIYPKDKNTFKIYSWSKRTLLHLLFMSFCIVVAATIPFFINKRSNSKAGKQINNLDLPTPTVSPSSWLHNSEIEMESLPWNSLSKATNVHYGKRPDLKKILLEINQMNVGVVASGPSGLRHEVAAICSSGLADNLHYESISFSW
ncbi:Ferric reduction oxidase 2 [Rhynchospora pubera]|uniref:ferric-chelate reductase (NADH) n=1 Tax=Rhynchospora pubera TaxID=906938 RepID=A0AAV8H2X6_9POAL|nr:Ferric reduction oxidase 2 [Rhynchospora pubera]